MQFTENQRKVIDAINDSRGKCLHEYHGHPLDAMAGGQISYYIQTPYQELDGRVVRSLFRRKVLENIGDGDFALIEQLRA